MQTYLRTFSTLFFLLVLLVIGSTVWGAGTQDAVPATGMLLWLKADALAKNTGDPVTGWTDASGNGRTAAFTQVNGKGVPPTFAAGAMNGKPAVRFAGNSLLRVSALPLGPFTIAAVFTTTANGEMVYEHSDGTHSYAVCRDGCLLTTGIDSTLSVKRSRVRADKDMTGKTAGAWAAQGGPVLAVTTFNGTDDSLQLYLNGAAQPLNQAEVNGLNSHNTVTAFFDIGERAYYGDMAFHGDLAEMIVYDHALSAPELTQLHSALQRKYRLSGSAPSIPTDGLHLWLKADSLALPDGAPVTTWPDSSGVAGHDARAITDAAGTQYTIPHTFKPPTFIANAQNGRPAVNFDLGPDHSIAAGIKVTGLAIEPSATYFLVAKRHSNSCNAANQAPVMYGRCTQDNARFNLTLTESELFFEAGNSPWHSLGAYQPDSFNRIMLINDASDPKNAAGAKCYMNNITTPSAAVLPAMEAPGCTGSEAPGTLWVGFGGWWKPDYLYDGAFRGEIAECIIYNRLLTNDELAQVDQYLKRKYGL